MAQEPNAGEPRTECGRLSQRRGKTASRGGGHTAWAPRQFHEATDQQVQKDAHIEQGATPEEQDLRDEADRVHRAILSGKMRGR